MTRRKDRSENCCTENPTTGEGRRSSSLLTRLILASRSGLRGRCLCVHTFDPAGEVLPPEVRRWVEVQRARRGVEGRLGDRRGDILPQRGRYRADPHLLAERGHFVDAPVQAHQLE